MYRTIQRSFTKVYPQFDRTNANKINKMPLKDYFEDLMRRRQNITAENLANILLECDRPGSRRPKPLNEMGYINLPQNNFSAMVDRMKTSEDVEVCKDAFVNYLGHRNLVQQGTIDKFMFKALEINQPELMFDFVKYHSELLYHPQTKVTQAYTDHFHAKGYDQLKKWFYSAMKGRYLMQRHDGFNQLVIDEAFKADDYQTVIEAYLDTLDYTKDLQDSAFVKVLESSSFAEAIDHVLFGHVKDNMDARNLDSRLQMSVYYFNIKGGLTSCDLINALAADDTIESVIESRLFKEDLVAKVLNEDYHLDGFVREKLMEALNNLRPKLNAEFYGLPDVAVAEEAATPAAEEVQAEAPKEQIESKQEESA